MQITIEQAKELLMIDKHNLDQECMSQSDIFFRIEEQVAMAISLKDHAKENLTQVDANLAKEIRQAAETNSIKLTEAKIQELIVTDEKHSKAMQEAIKAKYESDMWMNMKEAFAQRSSMLKEMCNLYLAGYYVRDSVKAKTDAIEYSQNRQLINERRKKLNE
jgi:hypothetical protein